MLLPIQRTQPSRTWGRNLPPSIFYLPTGGRKDFSENASIAGRVSFLARRTSRRRRTNRAWIGARTMWHRFPSQRYLKFRRSSRRRRTRHDEPRSGGPSGARHERNLGGAVGTAHGSTGICCQCIDQGNLTRLADLVTNRQSKDLLAASRLQRGQLGGDAFLVQQQSQQSTNPDRRQHQKRTASKV